MLRIIVAIPEHSSTADDIRTAMGGYEIYAVTDLSAWYPGCSQTRSITGNHWRILRWTEYLLELTIVLNAFEYKQYICSPYFAERDHKPSKTAEKEHGNLSSMKINILQGKQGF